jgi:hypothetical protein
MEEFFSKKYGDRVKLGALNRTKHGLPMRGPKPRTLLSICTSITFPAT